MDLKLSTLLCFTLLLFCSILIPTLSELCNSEDKKVLLDIKAAFNNPYILISWNPDVDCCTTWNNVECDPTTNRINSLTILSYDSISGQIPPQVGDLPYLETLVIRKQPNVTGPIQPTIAKLKHLKTLRLGWNNLSGSVPDFISQLKNLTFLELNYNNLSGSIPSSLSQFPNLTSLRLDRNKLTGHIPSSFGQFIGVNVPDLYLSHNLLKGKIPTSLRKMDFRSIDLSRNMLEGDASFLFGLNKTTQMVDLSRNMLEFDLSKVVFTDTLILLDLNHNRLAGSIPEQLTEVELQFFNVSYNRLCGQIPQGGKLQSFDNTTYFHNRCLCGTPLPSCK